MLVSSGSLMCALALCPANSWRRGVTPQLAEANQGHLRNQVPGISQLTVILTCALLGAVQSPAHDHIDYESRQGQPQSIQPLPTKIRNQESLLGNAERPWASCTPHAPTRQPCLEDSSKCNRLHGHCCSRRSKAPALHMLLTRQMPFFPFLIKM